MKVILLASGSSSRMWPLQNKTELVFCGKTLLQHQIERILRLDVTEIILVTNPQLQQVHEQYRSQCQGITIAVQEDSQSGIRGGIEAGIAKIHTNEPVLLMNSNDLVENSILEELAHKADNQDTDVTVVGKTVENYFPGGYLITNGSELTGIHEKPGRGNEPSNLINIFLHLYSSQEQIVAALAARTDADYEDSLHEALITGSLTGSVTSYDGQWQAVKFPWHVLSMSQTLLSQTLTLKSTNNPTLHGECTIVGDVVFGEGVQVYPYATIVGPAYIGDNCIIGSYSLVRESIIEADTVVGSYTEIARSVVQPHGEFHMNYIGDSVIGRGTHFGARSLTTNERLDRAEIKSVIKQQLEPTGLTKFGAVTGENSSIGAASVILPGRKICAQGVVYPHSIVQKDILSTAVTGDHVENSSPQNQQQNTLLTNTSASGE